MTFVSTIIPHQGKLISVPFACYLSFKMGYFVFEAHLIDDEPQPGQPLAESIVATQDLDKLLKDYEEDFVFLREQDAADWDDEMAMREG